MLFVVFALPFVLTVQGFQIHVHQNGKFDYNERKLFDRYEMFRNECSQGEYLNLCAECVLGDTEKEDDYGTDSCGICSGLETCRNQCDDPMNELDGELGDGKDCRKLVLMTPNVLDLAESVNGSICIYGDGVTPDNLESVQCSIKKDETFLVDIQGKVMMGKVQLEFPVPSAEGLYALYCNSSIGIEFKKDAQVVNSANLLPMSVDKPSILTWTENELAVKISKMSGPADVICFARDESGKIIYEEWTSAVEGNSLSSTVRCPRVVLVKPGEVEFGIAYSEKAVESAKTLKVTGVPVSPNPVSAIYKSEESKLVLTFDQNLDEEKLNDCSSMFKESTLSIFGKDPECIALANEIHIFIKSQINATETNIEFTNNVKTKYSEVVVEGSIRVNLSGNEARDPLRLEGEERVCRGDSSEVQIEGQQTGTPVWELHVATSKNLSSSDIPTGQKQRLNLMQWAVNRSSRAYPRALRFNTTEIPAGMKYTVRATAKDQSGTDRQASMDVTIVAMDAVWLEIRGPRRLNIRAEAIYQAVLKACTPSVKADKYVWNIMDEAGGAMDIGILNGMSMRLDGNHLHPNQDYNLTVQAYKADKLLAISSILIKTTIDNFELHLSEANLVVGTGQGIEVDASRSLDIDTKSLKFKWDCKKGHCFVPGKEKTDLNTLDTFSHPVLRLPPKSLAIGRYLFEVEAIMENIKAKSELEINVISGQPPYFSRIRTSDLEPGKDVSISIQVSEVLGPCDFSWQSAPALGYSHIQIEQNKTRVEGSPTSPESSTLMLTISKDILKPGGKYRLRTLADCGRLAQSHFEFQFQIPDGFPTCQLQVSPQKGIALDTIFTYNLNCNGSLQNYLLHFGFEDNGEAKFLSSGYDKEYKTILGQGNYKTLVKLCRTKTECMSAFGPEVTNTEASKVEDAKLSELVSSYNNYLANNDYECSKVFLEMMVPSIKQADMSGHVKFSEELLKIITRNIKAHSERLSTGTTEIAGSVKLLDLSISALSILENNEETMNEVLQFRNKIHQINQVISEKNMVKKISSNMPAEPRSQLAEQTYSRKKRSTVVSKLETTDEAVNVMLKLSSNVKNITNDTERITKERVLMLNHIVTYAAQFCNGTETTKEADSGDGFCMVGSSKFKTNQQMKKLALPQCNKVNCPNITGRASVNPENITSNSKDEGFCFATAYIRDEILSDVSSLKDNNMLSWGPVFWLDLLPYSNGVVEPLSNYSYLLPKSASNESLQANTTVSSYLLKNRGKVILQIPVWDKQKPNGTTLMCSRFENDIWNTSSCKQIKEDPNKLTCACPYPGYYSAFAVLVNEMSNKTESSRPPGTTVMATTNPIPPVPNPGQTVKTEAPITPTIALPTTTTVKPVMTQNEKITLNTSTGGATKAVTPAYQPSTTTVEKSPQKNQTKSSRGDKTTVTEVSNVSHTTAHPNANETHTNGTNNTPRLTTHPSTSSPTQHPTIVIPLPENVTSNIQIIQYKYFASFNIDENFTAKVGKNEEKFLQSLIDQLQSNFNLTLLPHVEEDKGKIRVTIKIEDGKLKEQSKPVAHLAELLKNGNLTLKGLDGEVLSIPKQNLHLEESNKPKISSATTAFIFAMVLFLMILILALITALYQRNTRERRTHRITQSLHEDPPAPKYLRLHDAVSLGSSGPSSPNNDMESSLAVVTRQRGRGYNTMDQFSNMPGNI